MANIQITEELFLKLVKYHLLDCEEFQESIKKDLQIKFNKIVERQTYTNYKTAATTEEREKAKLEYLKLKGIYN